ncbi:hypothetical protein GGS20DRAFT_361966 [Poronia punctata]|nr:hypothetical protein GGS20DRAFT_361966 [Poronia punctata]
MRKPLVGKGGALLSGQAVRRQILSRATGAKRALFPHLRISPGRVLSSLLNNHNNEPLSPSTQYALYLAAKARNERLPILTLQACLLQRKDLAIDKRISAALATKDETYWKDVTNSLATRGFSKEDVDHWAWILSGEDGDARIERLVSTDKPKPIFLTMLLLRKTETIRKAESLSAIMRYISNHHMNLLPPADKHNADSPETSEVLLRSKTLDHRLMLTVTQCLLLIPRLIFHVQKTWPRSIVAVGHLLARYIKSIPYDGFAHSKGHYTDQCRVYNTVLSHLSLPATVQPLINMEFNWRAQRVLLHMSDNLDKPLVLNKASYRAIRRVLIGMQKTSQEKQVASRYAKSWPPYRLDFDGRDTKRTTEDDRSRSVKAGILMKESGYSDSEYDRALDALGGLNANSSPTIQTRSVPPTESKDDQEYLNTCSQWAMNVRTTRNAQEAWRAFKGFRTKPGVEPNFQVYTEMFLKLLARPADPSSGREVLPGDAREALPVQNANYSEYELARLNPPTLSELYTEMIGRGVKPTGYGLCSLVTNARSLQEGLQYLEDSGLDPAVVRSIGLFKLPAFDTVRKIPLRYFASYIELLCRLQPKRRHGERVSNPELLHIRHAMTLADLRLSGGTPFRLPWYSILRVLARPNTAVREGSAVENHLEALSLFMKNFKSAQRLVGIDAELFILLCRVIEKAASSRLRSKSHRNHIDSTPLPEAAELLRTLTQSFSRLTRHVPTPYAESFPAPNPQFISSFIYQHPLAPPHLHSYMRALACLGAKDDMVRLVIWMMDNHTHVDQEASRMSNRGPAMIAKTFCAFTGFAAPALDEHVQQELDRRMEKVRATGSSWRWPTPEEVDRYTSGDSRGMSDILRARILAGLIQGHFGDQKQVEAAAE